MLPYVWGPSPAAFGQGTKSLMSIFLMGHLNEDTTEAQLSKAHTIGEGALPLPT